MIRKKDLKYSSSIHELLFMHADATVTDFFLHFLQELFYPQSLEQGKLVCGQRNCRNLCLQENGSLCFN